MRLAEETAMKLCVFNAKGGVGRTTLALNLAGHYAQQGFRVLLVDHDPQGSALAWAALAEETPFTVARGRSPGFDLEIHDMPPRIPEAGQLPAADLYVVPTLLDGVSYVVYLRTIEHLDRLGLPHLSVANRVLAHRGEHRGRLAAFKGPVIKERAAFASAYALGRTVFDYPGPHVNAAQFEITQLAEVIGERINPHHGRRAA